MATIVLIHGAFHGGWCWNLIVPLLEKQGHKVLAPDLAGMGGDRTPFRDLSFAAWADQIVAQIAGESEPVILAGHSRGGAVISEVAERAPHLLRRLVYITAFLLPNGHKVLADDSTFNVTLSDDGLSMLPPPSGADVLFHRCSPLLRNWALGLLGPEPVFGLSTRIKVTDTRFGSVPRVYIECTDDRAIQIEAQRAMYVALPCDQVLSIETDHSPFLSTPHELADHLQRIAVQY